MNAGPVGGGLGSEGVLGAVATVQESALALLQIAVFFLLQTEMPTPVETPRPPVSSSVLDALGLTLSQPVQVIVVVIAAFVVAKLLEMVGERLVATFDPTRGSIRSVVFEEIHVPLYVSVFLWGVYESLLIVGEAEPGWIAQAVVTMAVMLWARAAIRVGRRGMERAKEGEREYEFAPMVKNLWSVGVVIVTIGAILAIWRVDLTPLLASAGILGIIIGFAARDAVANFIGGIALYFDDTYKLGDFIVLETGEKGTVVDIGLRSTTLLTRDRVMVTVPNSVLNSAHVVNESAPQRYKRIRVPIQVAYGVDTDQIEEILMEESMNATAVKTTPAPEIRLTEFGDNGINYELRVFVAHPTREGSARHHVNTAVYNRFAEEGIEIPFPQRDLWMRDSSAATAGPVGPVDPVDSDPSDRDQADRDPVDADPVDRDPTDRED